MHHLPMHQVDRQPRRRLLRYARLSHQNLERNEAHMAALNCAFTYYAGKTIFSFVPKNGCISLRTSIAAANGAILGPKDWHWIHNNSRVFRPTMGDLATAAYTFTVLRCPYRRLGSAYFDRVVRDRADGLSLRRYARLAALPATLRRKRGLIGHGTSGNVRDNSRLHADATVGETARMRETGVLPDYGSLYDEELHARVTRLYAADVELYGREFGADAMLNFWTPTNSREDRI